MARLWTCGFEWNDTTADQLTTATGTRVLTGMRTGVYGGKVDLTSAGQDFGNTFSGASGNAGTYFFRAYVNFSSITSGSGGTPKRTVLYEVTTGVGISLNSANNFQFQPPGAVSLTGATFTPSLNTWYRLELSFQPSGGAWEWRVDGSTIATGTNTSGLAPTSLRVGGGGSSGGGTPPTYVAIFDDIALNDDTGSAQTSWAGDGKVVLLKPVSLNANGGSWTDDNAATTSAALTAAIDNTPPAGIASTTSGGGGHEVRNAGANTNLDMNLTDYTTAGVGSSDTVNVLTPMCVVGAPVSTGGKSGSFGITSNPTIAQRAFTGGSGTPAFYWRGTAAGTYPTGWGWEIGTTTYAPTVTVGTSPVARLSITAGTASRIAMCCDLGMYVDYTPAATGTTYTKAGHAVESA